MSDLHYPMWRTRPVAEGERIYERVPDLDARLREMERIRDVLIRRCAEQARLVAKLARAPAEPEAPRPDPHPVMAAIEAMQRGGIR